MDGLDRSVGEWMDGLVHSLVDGFIDGWMDRLID